MSQEIQTALMEQTKVIDVKQHDVKADLAQVEPAVIEAQQGQWSVIVGGIPGIIGQLWPYINIDIIIYDIEIWKINFLCEFDNFHDAHNKVLVPFRLACCQKNWSFLSLR